MRVASNWSSAVPCGAGCPASSTCRAWVCSSCRADRPFAPELPIAHGTTAYARSKAQAEVYVRRLQDEGAPIRISYPAGIFGPEDPGMSAATGGFASWPTVILVTSSGLSVVDVRDLAALHLKLLELPCGPHRYAATAEMLSWADVHALMENLTGHRIRRLRVPGRLMRAVGSVGDALKLVHDFDYPLTRDTMEFTTRWPGADATRTTEELGIVFRDASDTFRDTLVWMYRAGRLTAAQVGRLAEHEEAAR